MRARVYPLLPGLVPLTAVSAATCIQLHIATQPKDSRQMNSSISQLKFEKKCPVCKKTYRRGHNSCGTQSHRAYRNKKVAAGLQSDDSTASSGSSNQPRVTPANAAEIRRMAILQPRPQREIASKRPVSDTAPVILFALNGDVKGLQSLFSRGLASPRDVSHSRNYNLIMVSHTPLFLPEC